MSLRTVRNLILITCLSVSGSACSFAFVDGPPSGHENLEDFTCTESRLLPALDGVWAGLGGVLAAVAASEESTSASGDAILGTGIAVGVGFLVLNGASSITGFRRVNSCRAAQSELARRSQEVAERARLLTRANSTAGDATATKTRNLALKPEPLWSVADRTGSDQDRHPLAAPAFDQREGPGLPHQRSNFGSASPSNKQAPQSGDPIRMTGGGR